MRFTSQTCFRALAEAGALFAALAVDRTPALGADAVDEQIAAMKGFEKAGEDGKCIAKMQEMKDSFGDTRVLKAIKDMIGSKNEKIACAAVKMIAAKNPKDLEFLKLICNRVDEKSDLYKEKDKGGNPDLVCAYLDAIVSYKADKASQATIKAALPKFADVVKKFLTTNDQFSTRAIRAYGCVRDKFTMEQLLDWGEQTEARAGGGGGGGSKKGLSTEAKDMMNKAKKVILEVLTDITGKEMVDVTSARKWWTENMKTFVFPDPADPNAPEKPMAGPVIPEGVDYKDEAYGYSVKRPDAPGWSFIKPDYDGPRIALNFAEPGDPKYTLARAYIEVYNTNKSPPKDVKALVEWVKDKPIKEQVDTHDKAPEVKEIKGASVEWTCVEAKGDGIGIKHGWGTIQRRFYLVKFDVYMMWVDAFIRTGAEDETKAALWKAIEDITLPPAKK